MIKRIVIFLVLIFSFAAFGATAEFQVPAFTNNVVDTAKLLKKDELAKVSAAVKSFNDTTKGQFAVCIVPSMNGEAVENASMKVAEKWKVGNKGQDNGILLFIAKNDRQFRIEVGYGYEGKLNDAKCGDMARELTKYFKNEKYADGIQYVIYSCQSEVSGEKAQFIKDVETGKAALKVFGIFIGSIALVLLVIGLILAPAEICQLLYIILVACVSGGKGGGGGGFGGGKGGGFGGGGASGRW